MAFRREKTTLSPADHLARQHLLVSDALSLTILFAIIVALALITNTLYQSYASHQSFLSRRWRARGESSLRRGDPQAAVYALHSALALAPGDPAIEMDLAESLAAAGRLQEAAAYFNTLAESQPGAGIIRLQLARLAVREGKASQALEDYRRAINGDWEGNGALRRREVRLEMIGFLLSTGRSEQARNELLVAASNAPVGDTPVLLNIARLMEKAQAPADALALYKSLLSHHPSLFPALEGAGRIAFETGHYAQAVPYLERAVNASEVAHLPGGQAEKLRDMLSQSQHLLLLYPSLQLSLHDRDLRILTGRNIAHARLTSCLATQTAKSQPAVSANPPASQPQDNHNPLASLARRFGHHSAKPASTPPTPSPADKLQGLNARWNQLPAKITLSDLANQPELASTQIQLIYDTEIVTAQVCGSPTDEDDALLLKIAKSPNTVDQE